MDIATMSAKKLFAVLFETFTTAFKVDIKQRIPWKATAASATTTKQKMSPIFQEYNIETGYRPSNQPWAFYLFSLFWLHNETVNVWSHILGAAAMLFEMHHFALVCGHACTPLTSGVMQLFTFSAVLLQLSSVAAHLMHNRGEHVHCVLFFCDNCAAALIGFVNNVLVFVFISTPDYHQAMLPYFLPINLGLGLLVAFTYNYALARYRRRYNWRTSLLMFGPTGAYFLWGAAPFLHKFFAYYCLGMRDIDCKFYYLSHVALFGIAAMFYITSIPERFFKGKFDIIGHGHQFFHVFYSFSLLAFFWAVRRDMSEGLSPMLSGATSPVINIHEAYLYYAFLFLGNICIVIYLYFTFVSDEKEKPN